MEQQPFEVVEGGWGEFEIGIQVRCCSVCFPSSAEANISRSCQFSGCQIARSTTFRSCKMQVNTPWWSAMQLYFQDDCCEKPLELAHKLKLYTDDDRHPQQSSKKPVCQLASAADWCLAVVSHRCNDYVTIAQQQRLGGSAKRRKSRHWVSC
jgi:YEATS family